MVTGSNLMAFGRYPGRHCIGGFTLRNAQYLVLLVLYSSQHDDPPGGMCCLMRTRSQKLFGAHKHTWMSPADGI